MALELNLDFLDELEDAAFRALEKTADTLLADVKAADVMPYRGGELEGETFVEPDRENNKVSIVSPKEYAHNVYTHPEYVFLREKTPMHRVSGLSLGYPAKTKIVQQKSSRHI